jgi:hypothetical protein
MSLVTDASGETVMTVDTFSMDAELAPFLSGEVLIFDMRIDRPDVLITVIDEDGMLDWSARPRRCRSITSTAFRSRKGDDHRTGASR